MELVARTFTAGLFWHPGKNDGEEEKSEDGDECFHAVIGLIGIGFGSLRTEEAHFARSPPLLPNSAM